jgi:hypothetical protein
MWQRARARESVCERDFTKLYLTEKPKSSVACMSAPALYNISSTAMSPEYAACVYREREINIEKERERRSERGSAKGRVLQRKAKLSKFCRKNFGILMCTSNSSECTCSVCVCVCVCMCVCVCICVCVCVVSTYVQVFSIKTWCAHVLLLPNLIFGSAPFFNRRAIKLICRYWRRRKWRSEGGRRSERM